MTTYSIDLSTTFEATFSNTGTDDGTPWGGFAGEQRAFKAAIAGDTIKCRNAATPTNTVKLSVL